MEFKPFSSFLIDSWLLSLLRWTIIVLITFLIQNILIHNVAAPAIEITILFLFKKRFLLVNFDMLILDNIFIFIYY